MTISFLKEVKKASQTKLSPEDILRQAMTREEYKDVTASLQRQRQEAQENDLNRLEKSIDQRDTYNPYSFLANLRQEIEVSAKGPFAFDAIVGMWRLKTGKRGLVGRVSHRDVQEWLSERPELYAEVSSKDTAKEQEDLVLEHMKMPGREFPSFTLEVNFFGHTHYSPMTIDKLYNEIPWISDHDYQMWKAMAKESFIPNTTALIQEFRSRYPHSQPFSFTCSERSEKLLSNHPLITVHKGFAFI